MKHKNAAIFSGCGVFVVYGDVMLSPSIAMD